MSEILIFGVSGEQLPADCLHSLQTCCAVVVVSHVHQVIL